MCQRGRTWRCSKAGRRAGTCVHGRYRFRFRFRSAVGIVGARWLPIQINCCDRSACARACVCVCVRASFSLSLCVCTSLCYTKGRKPGQRTRRGRKGSLQGGLVVTPIQIKPRGSYEALPLCTTPTTGRAGQAAGTISCLSCPRVEALIACTCSPVCGCPMSEQLLDAYVVSNGRCCYCACTKDSAMTHQCLEAYEVLCTSPKAGQAVEETVLVVDARLQIPLAPLLVLLVPP